MIKQDLTQGDEFIITKIGVPVSKLVPVIDRPESLFGVNKKELTIKGDIMEPLNEEWEGKLKRIDTQI